MRLNRCSVIAACAGLAVATTVRADEGCASVSLRKFSDPNTRVRAISGKHEVAEFRINEKFVLCVQLKETSYISIQDIGPNGDAQVLYPNNWKQPELKTEDIPRAARHEVGLHCFGTPTTFPMHFPRRQGTGEGKFSVFVTRTMDGQFKPGDFVAGGLRLKRNTVEDALRADIGEPDAGMRCAPVEPRYVTYRVKN